MEKTINEGLHTIYSGPNVMGVIKSIMSLARHVACMVDMGDAYRILVGRPDGKRSPGTPRHIWEDNIKMYLQEVGGGGIH